jgi:transcriptional regulator with XRE-family HTH domain
MEVHMATRAYVLSSLQARCMETIRREGTNVRAFARSTGIAPSTIVHWLRGEQETLRSDHLHALATRLGISYAQALDEAGAAWLSRDDRKRRKRVAPDDRASVASAVDTSMFPTPGRTPGTAALVWSAGAVVRSCD